MRKPDFCKGTESAALLPCLCFLLHRCMIPLLRLGTCTYIHVHVNPNFEAKAVCTLYSPICVGPCQNSPRFSHDAAQLSYCK